jgi:plastocyanin
VKARFLIALLAAVLISNACGGDSGSDDVVAGDDVTVAMYDNRFQYTEVRIPVGGSVTWVGAGANPHNSQDAGGTWSTETVFGSLSQLKGDEATLTYDTSGRYVFFCTFHGNAEGAGMAGMLVVGDE